MATVTSSMYDKRSIDTLQPSSGQPLAWGEPEPFVKPKPESSVHAFEPLHLPMFTGIRCEPGNYAGPIFISILTSLECTCKYSSEISGRTTIRTQFPQI